MLLPGRHQLYFQPPRLKCSLVSFPSRAGRIYMPGMNSSPAIFTWRQYSMHVPAGTRGRGTAYSRAWVRMFSCNRGEMWNGRERRASSFGPNRRDQANLFGLQQQAKRPNNGKAKLGGQAARGFIVEQDEVRLGLQRQCKSLALARSQEGFERSCAEWLAKLPDLEPFGSTRPASSRATAGGIRMVESKIFRTRSSSPRWSRATIGLVFETIRN